MLSLDCNHIQICRIQNRSKGIETIHVVIRLWSHTDMSYPEPIYTSIGNIYVVIRLWSHRDMPYPEPIYKYRKQFPILVDQFWIRHVSMWPQSNDNMYVSFTCRSILDTVCLQLITSNDNMYGSYSCKSVLSTVCIQSRSTRIGH
jgi:hypothetical protein